MDFQLFEGVIQKKSFVSKEFVIEFLENELSKDIFQHQNRKVRIKCKIQNKFCQLMGYELSPFRDDTDLLPWTIKEIPQYVYKKQISFNPVVSPDGRSLFWTAVKDTKSLYTQKIFSSKMSEGGFWLPGEKFGKILNNKFSSAILSVLPNEKELLIFGNYGEKILINRLNRLFFKERTRLQLAEKNSYILQLKLNNLKEAYNFRINQIYERVPLYISKERGNSWSIPKSIAFDNYYNLYKIDVRGKSQVIFGGANLSSNGNFLIYASMHKDSRGKLDLYVSQKNSKGQFDIGKNLGNFINTKDEETAPFLASDNRTLYFSSNRSESINLYFTRRIDDTWVNWTEPKKISEKLKGVNFFSIPAQGNWAYASRDGKLIMIYLPVNYRPQSTLIVQGKVYNQEKKPIRTKVYYKSFNDAANQGYVQTNEMGEYGLTLPYGEGYDFYVESKKYLPKTKKIDLSQKEFSNKIERIDFELPNIKKGAEIELENIFFDFENYEISEEAKPEINRLGKLLQKYPNMSVEIQGHTDNIGEKDYNLKLSQKRADSVTNYLVEKFQISREKIRSVGFGESQPITGNKTEKEREKNRRVIFKIINN